MISTRRLRESSGKNSFPFLATQYFDEVAVIFEFAAEVTPGVSGAHDCLVEQLPAAIRLFFYQTEQINNCAGADFNAKQITVRCDFMIPHPGGAVKDLNANVNLSKNGKIKLTCGAVMCYNAREGRDEGCEKHVCC